MQAVHFSWVPPNILKTLLLFWPCEKYNTNLLWQTSSKLTSSSCELLCKLERDWYIKWSTCSADLSTFVIFGAPRHVNERPMSLEQDTQQESDI